MAKKYIDAELLRNEIEKRKNICNGVYERDSDTYYQGKAVAYQETLSLIDSLQQEQPCDTCTNHKGCVTCKDGELWEGKEQPCEDLEEEIAVAIYKIDGTGKTHLVKEDELYDFARHFYELGKQSKK